MSFYRKRRDTLPCVGIDMERIMLTLKSVFRHMWEIVRFALFTPSWGSKRRAEQRAYEDRLDEAMRRSQSEQ